MRRRLLLLSASAALLLVPLAAAQSPFPQGPLTAASPPVPLMPGVTAEQHSELTPHGPVAYTVITAPAPGGLTTLGPVLGGGTVSGPRQSMRQLEESISGNAIAAGVDGDFSSGTNELPSGMVMVGGVLEHAPTPAHASIGFDASGGMHVGRVSFSGTWQGAGPRRPLAGVNQRPRPGQTVLFTPAWGASTPAVANAAEVVLEPFPAATPGTDLTATVGSATSGPELVGTTVLIPSDGAVLVADGSEAAKLQSDAPEGGKVTVRLILPDAWASMVSALGGGPLLVKGGRPVFSTGENFDATDLNVRQARAAVGQLSDGHVILVAVDGGRPGYSVGMTNYELAQTMAKLGAVTAAGLQYGRGVAASFDGDLLDRSNGGVHPQPVKEALLVQYAGVVALPPSVPVLDKGDAPAGEQLGYRLIRPSNVTAVVVGPDGVSHPVDQGSRQPGTYHLPFTGIDAEGTWRFTVQATDDSGRASSAEQDFVFDATLTGLTASASADGLSAAFTLSRPASVALAIVAPNGTVVASVPAAQLQVGAQTLAWDGTAATGAKAPPGAYVAVVTETSSLGTVAFHAAFRLHR